jgi:hypothetical protein
MKQHSKHNRSSLSDTKPLFDFTPTPRALRWLKHIERHGPQSSIYLHELTRDTHRCKDTALRQLQKLRLGGFLTLPKQQRATEHSQFNSYIYDLGKSAKEYLYEYGLEENTVRPHGHWVHQYMTSCVTSSIDIMAARNGIRYIPTHEILALKGSTLSVPFGNRRLIPDQLFALDYGGKFRAFALEVDRGTEPKTSNQLRKSYAASIKLYSRLIDDQYYQRHYGLSANLIVLWVFSCRRNQDRFLGLVSESGGALRHVLFTLVVSGFHQSWKPPDLFGRLYSGNWTGPLDRIINIDKN